MRIFNTKKVRKNQIEKSAGKFKFFFTFKFVRKLAQISDIDPFWMTHANGTNYTVHFEYFKE